MTTLRADLLRIAAALPPGDETRRQLLAVLKEAGDIKVESVDFASGQEPGGFDDDFITLMEATFTISGKALARLFGKQQRVMDRYLSKLSEREALWPLKQGGRAADEVLKAVTPVLVKELGWYVLEEFQDREARRVKVDWAELQDLASAKIDPRRQAVTYTMEFDVLGEWDWLD